MSAEDTVQMDLFDKKTYTHHCKWCGKGFVKHHNREMYCSDNCRLYALREQKARYQSKRRLQIKRKLIILPEEKRFGLGSYGTMCSGHRREDFKEEYEAILKEKKRLGLK